MSNDILTRYEQAQVLMQGVLSNRVVMNDAVFPHWIENSNNFWYIREMPDGKQFRIVEAETGSNTLAFDHEDLSNTLSKATAKPVNHLDLPIENLSMTLSPLQIRFLAFGKHWHFEPYTEQFQEIEEPSRELLSPDGGKSVYVRDHNIWIRDQTTGNEEALTKNGFADYSYSCSQFDTNEIQALWSPNSKLLFTVILDTREVASRPYIHYVPQDGSPHPQLIQIKSAYPGDEHVETYKLVVIDVDTGNLQEADYPSIPLTYYGEQVFGFFSANLGWWSPNSQFTTFIDVARGSKAVRVVELDTYTGNTRVLFEEHSDTFVKIRHEYMDIPMFLPIPESNELIWFSERSGWGHLYLYDLNTGALKHPITEGKWLVRDVLHCDIKKREILIQTAARDQCISPYYRDICTVNIDTGVITPLVYGDFEYSVYHPHSNVVWNRNGARIDNLDVNGVSPTGHYCVTTRSRVDTAPVSILIDREGREILTLEIADVAGLPEGWNWPEPVGLKGADDHTDIYGVVFRPPGFSTKKRYPVLDFSCSMRGFCALPQGSFVNSPLSGFTYFTAAALAALGFIVVAMEGRGTPNRDKTFQEHRFGDPASTSDCTDRIAYLEQLAERYSYIDLERVGITGLDTQTNSVYALLNHANFYKVAVVHCLMDPRFTLASLGETYDGSTGTRVMPESLHTEDFGDLLKGKLLLIQGMLDFATPSSTFRLIESLQKANKDFDMLCLTNEGHSVPTYALRRNWDYLVKHLQGIEPPKEFQLTTGLDLLGIFH